LLRVLLFALGRVLTLLDLRRVELLLARKVRFKKKKKKTSRMGWFALSEKHIL